MNLSKSILCAVSLILVMNSFSQIETEKKVSITEVQLFSGSLLYPVPQLTLAEMNAFAPNSMILAKDLSGFNNGNYNSVYTNQSFSALLGLTFKSKPNPLLRIGVNYANKTNFTGSAYRDETYAYDTLTSSQTGEQYYLDSTISKSVYMDQSVEQLALDASLLFRTDPEARWSLQGGVGVMLGFSFNSSTRLSYNEWTTVPYGNASQSGSNGSQFEQFRNENYMSTSLYLPFGVDFRIGQKREFWNRIHLFYELRPSVSIAAIPEWNTLTQFNLTQGIGIKIKW